LSLCVQSVDHVSATVSPAVEIGWSRFDHGIEIRPFARAGFTTFLSGRAAYAAAAFEGAPAGTPVLVATEPLDSTVADLRGGVSVVGAKGFALKLFYAGKIGATTHENRVGLNAIIPF
jgi:hypothetical protein